MSNEIYVFFLSQNLPIVGFEPGWVLTNGAPLQYQCSVD